MMLDLLLATALFASLSGLLIAAGARTWAQPKSVIDRITEGRYPARRSQRLTPAEKIRDLLGTLVPTSRRHTAVLEQRLSAAGFRKPGALKLLYGVKAGSAIAAAACCLAITARFPLEAPRRVAGAAVFAAGGFFAPNRLLRMQAARRHKQIRRALPNALDLLVVCVESGLGLDQAILQAARELERAHPEISQELTMVNLELKAGEARANALRNLATRTGVDEVRKLAAVLIQCDRFGTSIAQTLRAHSDYIRSCARQAAEEKAAKLGVKLVFPIFFFILPSLFVATVGPMVVKIFRELLPMMKSI